MHETPVDPNDPATQGEPEPNGNDEPNGEQTGTADPNTEPADPAEA